jgi:hypothetical protein
VDDNAFGDILAFDHDPVHSSSARGLAAPV